MLAVVWGTRHFRPYLYVGDLLSEQTTTRSGGSITLRSQKDKWPDSWSFYQNLTTEIFISLVHSTLTLIPFLVCHVHSAVYLWTAQKFLGVTL